MRQQCRNAPPFHSIIAAARPSNCCVTTYLEVELAALFPLSGEAGRIAAQQQLAQVALVPDRAEGSLDLLFGHGDESLTGRDDFPDREPCAYQLRPGHSAPIEPSGILACRAKPAGSLWRKRVYDVSQT